MFLALGSPSALTVIRKPTSANVEPRRVRMRASAGDRPPPVMQIEIVDTEWHIGAKGLAKRILGTGMMKRIHMECEGMTAAKGLTGSKGLMAAAGKGVADAKSPLCASSGHTACGKGIECLMRARDLPRVIVLVLIEGPIGVVLA